MPSLIIRSTPALRLFTSIVFVASTSPPSAVVKAGIMPMTPRRSCAVTTTGILLSRDLLLQLVVTYGAQAARFTDRWRHHTWLAKLSQPEEALTGYRTERRLHAHRTKHTSCGTDEALPGACPCLGAEA